MNKKMPRKDLINMVEDMVKRDKVNERLSISSKSNIDKNFAILDSSEKGKTKTQVKSAKELHGENIVTYSAKDSLFKKLIQAFINPFTMILIALAVVSTFADVILADPLEKDLTTVIIIITLILISGMDWQPLFEQINSEQEFVFETPAITPF